MPVLLGLKALDYLVVDDLLLLQFRELLPAFPE
jgi:hypothetical protein